jgi:hypothetical protein
MESNGPKDCHVAKPQSPILIVVDRQRQSGDHRLFWSSRQVLQRQGSSYR